jgi:hypothetical protein
MLPGEAIRGTSSFEWLDGRRFVIWRSHYDHPKIPAGITIIGVTEGRLSMHHFDQRGVYRVYAVSLDLATWRFWRDATAPDFSQRYSGSFSDDGNTITGRGQLSRDGKTSAVTGDEIRRLPFATDADIRCLSIKSDCRL